MPRRLVPLAVLAALLGLLATAVPAVAVTPPPSATDVDYQLGGPATVPANVGIVVRDRTAAPVPGRYNICYVNGFQTQPDAKRFWRARWGLVLQDRRGRPVVDEAWGEWLLDLRTGEKRRRIAAIVGRWTAGCARAGYDAVEFDNLDSFTRSRGLLKRHQALRFARLLTRAAHRAGLAAGQKNLAGLDGTRVGYDFAVSEQCGRYDECGAYVDAFGDRVIVVEYRARDFRRTCAAWGDRLPVVLRDLDLRPGGLRRWC
ncbi:endo alpha-1,4 polygalactosaminidase [Nocardioides sp. SYSU D00038]|uniref:endo alpha-1,4 polygalactosaminidase n=1 Tax=Nocardioides sp. SYSU D00038 TaxID=2812554 RepID=UPI001968338B|nr:endo alpha-1,4 polygalactosaminidase [Nocardioides sp. SYSU D00038]